MTRLQMWACLWSLMWACLHLTTPTCAVRLWGTNEEETPAVADAIDRLTRVLATQESHTALYERVALLETTLSERAESEARLEAEVLQLKVRIPALEAEIDTIPKMRKDLADFEAKIEKLVHDYEAKLSTLATEVIRLKKSGARRKGLQILSDQSDNVMLRTEEPLCPEVGLGMFGERVGDQCMYFSWGSALNWTSAHRQCQSLGGDLAAPQNLMALKSFLNRAFARGPSIWLGVSYDLDDEGGGGEGDNGTLTQTTHDALLRDAPVILEEMEEEGEPVVRVQHDQAMEFPHHLLTGDGIEAARRRFFNTSHLRDEMFLGRGGKGGEGSKVSLPAPTTQTRRVTSVVDLVLLPEEKVVSSTPPMEAQLGDLKDRPVLVASPDGAGVTRDERAAVGGNYVSPGSHALPPRPTDEDVGRRDGRAGMKCMLLQQKEWEWELVGSPCTELHRFACEIISIDENMDMKFALDNLLHE